MSLVGLRRCGASPRTAAPAHAFACARNNTAALPLVESPAVGGYGGSYLAVAEGPLARRRERRSVVATPAADHPWQTTVMLAVACQQLSRAHDDHCGRTPWCAW
jgi:hypothetical protein